MEDKELELSEDVIKLVRANFEESVKQFGDYLDRRRRDSIAYPNFSNYVRQNNSVEKVVKPISPLREVWEELFDAMRIKRGVNTSNEALQQELGIKNAYYTSLNNQVITHIHFSNIEAAIEREEIDDNIAQELLEGFAEFTPVIANPVMMAAKIARGGKEVLHTAIDYASRLANVGNNRQLDKLMMIYRGLQELGNNKLIKYFEDKIDAEMLEKVQNHQQREQIKNMWQEFFDAIRSKSEVEASNQALQQKLGLDGAYNRSLNNLITHTHFSNIETAIEREELDDKTVQELLEGFAEFTPVIANPVMMAAKIARGGEGVLHTAIEYASRLRRQSINNRLENLTMIYLGLQELGDKELVEYFENEIGVKIDQLQIRKVWEDLFDAIRSERVVKASNKVLQQVLGLDGAYDSSSSSQVITHTYFANIEAAIKREKLDNKAAQELLEGFAEFTPVIANAELMADKIKQGGEEVLHTSIEYASKLLNKGYNNQLKNLTMIYLGLKKLNNNKLIKYFESKIDAEMLEKVQNHQQREQIKNMWQEFFDAIRSKSEVEASNQALQRELGLDGAYNSSSSSQVITHTYFSNIEAAIKREELDNDTAQELLEGFAEFTPVIANAELMADKIKQGGEEVLHTAVDYASRLPNVGGNNIQLENLTMIYRGLQELGDKELVEYFENEIGVKIDQLQIRKVWQELFNAIRSKSEVKASNRVSQRELGLNGAYNSSSSSQVITHTYFSNIEATIKREGLDDKTVQELLEGFAEFTPVIANTKLMADKIKRGGEDVLHTAVEYASKLRNGGDNGKLDNLTMIYRGLQELGNKELVEYFEDKIGTEMLEKLQLMEVWQELFNAIRSERVVKASNKALQRELGLNGAYRKSIKNQVITYTYFANIEAAIERAIKRKSLDDNTAQKLLEGFAEFTPVIANAELMAAKIKRGREEVLHTAIDYASRLPNVGGNNRQLENLTMIYRGLQKLGDKKLIEYFENEIGVEMLKRIKSKM